MLGCRSPGRRQPSAPGKETEGGGQVECGEDALAPEESTERKYLRAGSGLRERNGLAAGRGKTITVEDFRTKLASGVQTRRDAFLTVNLTQ